MKLMSEMFGFLATLFVSIGIGTVSAATTYYAQRQVYSVADLLRDLLILALIIGAIWYFVFRKKETDTPKEKGKD
jgi:Na+-driven multidrug efflux pump